MSLMSTEEKIRHYQRSIDRSHYDKARLMHCISVLSKLPVTVHHLQITGVGRTVNSLRKFDEGVGEAAKRLVGKWKVMVANTDTSEEEDEACVPDVPESYESPDCDSDTEKSNQNDTNDCDEAIRKLADSPDSPPGMVIENNDVDNSLYHNNDDDLDSNEEGKEDNATADKSENKHKHKSGHNSRQHSSDKHESSKERSKNREKSSSSSSKSRHADDKKRKHESNESLTHAEESSKKRRNNSTEEEPEQDSDYQFVMNDTEEDKEKSSSEEDVHRKDKVSSRKSDKHNNESKVKSKHHNSSSHKAKTHESSDKVKKDEKSTPKLDDTSKEDKRKNEESRSKESSRSRSSSSSKNESKSKDKNRDKHSRDSSGSSKHTKVVKDDKGKSKDDEDREKVKEDKDSKPHKEKKKHKKDKESKEGKERKKEKKDPTKGIDSNSGTSFADALGMCPMPPPSKKKKESSSSSLPKSNKTEKTSSASSSTSSLGSPTPSCSKSSSSIDKFISPDSPESLPLLAPNIKLAPLSRIEEEVDLAATLPEPSLNYKPLPQLSHVQRKLDEDEMLSQVIHAKNLRTKVYSGNKTGYTNVPTLYDMCIRVLIENIEALEYTGGVPYYIIKPVLERATPDQLFMLEHHNPYLIEESDSLWQFHCNKDFRNKKREEMESWREMYMRCLDEREAKLKSLTANIRQQQIEKAAPVRQTKLAYVDNIVKPPRNVMRKQAKYGTANHTTPSDAKKKLIAAALGTPSSSSGGAPVERISVPPPPVHRGRPPSSNPVKKVKAPLMAKALQAIKGRYKR